MRAEQKGKAINLTQYIEENNIKLTVDQKPKMHVVMPAAKECVLFTRASLRAIHSPIPPVVKKVIREPMGNCLLFMTVLPQILLSQNSLHLLIAGGTTIVTKGYGYLMNSR